MKIKKLNMLLKLKNGLLFLLLFSSCSGSEVQNAPDPKEARSESQQTNSKKQTSNSGLQEAPTEAQDKPAQHVQREHTSKEDEVKSLLSISENKKEALFSTPSSDLQIAAQSTDQSNLASLDLRIMTGPHKHEMMDVTDFADERGIPELERGVLADSNRIMIRKNLFLNGHNDYLFFTWSHFRTDLPIVNVNYTHRILNSENEEIAWSRTRESAIHDLHQQLWYVPLEQIIDNLISRSGKYERVNLDYSQTQELTLEIVHENGIPAVVQILFQVSGPLPELHRSDLGLEIKPAVHFSKTVSKSGWVVRREQIMNPTDRTFAVRIRAETSKNGLRLNTYFQHPFYLQNGNEPPRYAGIHSKVSSGQLSVYEVWVERRNSAEREILPLQSNSWQTFILNSNESIVLHWKALPAHGTIAYEMPQKTIETFRWVTTHLVNKGSWLGDLWEIADEHHEVVREYDWTLVGGKIEGSFNAELQLDYPILKESSLSSRLRLEPIDLGVSSTDVEIPYQLVPQEVLPMSNSGFLK